MHYTIVWVSRNTRDPVRRRIMRDAEGGVPYKPETEKTVPPQRGETDYLVM